MHDDPYVAGRSTSAWGSLRDWWRSADEDLRAIVLVVVVDVLAVVVMLTTFLATLVPHFV